MGDAGAVPTASRYEGRLPVAEFVQMDEPLRNGIMRRDDIDGLARAYSAQPGFVPMRRVADDLVGRGLSDEMEISRILGAETR